MSKEGGTGDEVMRSVEFEQEGLTGFQRFETRLPPWPPEVHLVDFRLWGEKGKAIVVSIVVPIQPFMVCASDPLHPIRFDQLFLVAHRVLILPKCQLFTGVLNSLNSLWL